MTTPKSPEEVLKEYEELIIKRARIGVIMPVESSFLRSSMASLLCYMAERMTKKGKDICAGCEFGVQGGCACAYSVHNDTIDDCRTLLIEEARKITNETEKETCRHPQGFTDVNPFAALPPELRCQICWELKITNNE